MELRDKIEKLIMGLGISAARFADYIEVSRPIISHILNNRNKPTLEFCQKITAKFPELGYDWIFEETPLDKDIILKLSKKFNFNQFPEDFYNERELNIPDYGEANQKISNSQNTPENERKEVKVMVFYSDGTFETFLPK